MATIRMFLGLFVVAAGIFLAVKIVPPYFANYEFQDFLETEARSASYSSRMTEDDVRSEVMKKAIDLGVPITKDDIKVQKGGAGGVVPVSVSVDYTVHVDLLVYAMDLRFTPSSQNKPI